MLDAPLSSEFGRVDGGASTRAETSGGGYSYDGNVNGKPGRPRSETPARARSFWLTDQMWDTLVEVAEVEGVTPSELARQALAFHLAVLRATPRP